MFGWNDRATTAEVKYRIGGEKPGRVVSVGWGTYEVTVPDDPNADVTYRGPHHTNRDPRPELTVAPDRARPTFNAALFGERLKGMRAFHRISLQKLADKAGMSKAHVWELESGYSRNPSVTSVWALAAALDVSPAYLLGLTPEPIAIPRDSGSGSKSEDAGTAAEAVGPQSGDAEGSASPTPSIGSSQGDRDG